MIVGARRGKPISYDAPPAVLSLRVPFVLGILGCFLRERPTLTVREISELADLPARDVMRAAGGMTRLGYLKPGTQCGKSTWTLMIDE